MTAITLQMARATWPTDTRWWQNGAAAPELERLFAGGESYLSLAKRFGTNPDDIYKRVKQLGLIDKYPRGPGGRHMRPRKDKDGKTRTCLRCRRPFKSAGNHNHLCPSCQRANRADTGMDF